MIVTLRLSAAQALTPLERRVLRAVADRIDLGDPARWDDDTATTHLVWRDGRIGLRDVAVLGTIAARLDDIPAGWRPPMRGGRIDRRALRRQVRRWVAPHIVWPADPTDPADPGPTPAAVLAAQGAPAAVGAYHELPAGWTPVAAASPVP